ncbi:MAG TPA: fumarylacetoacetate hydrolase family protein [Burkholderiales bacterium]|jgi:2-keto-4-pentenoate hydratase/2-oxohepta-3-ene-1,7-dioic acid hydratase in catechol pathway|nr:fumarylacetoacetate hydrolase family protein [Burkholderiales bacterium]
MAWVALGSYLRKSSLRPALLHGNTAFDLEEAARLAGVKLAKTWLGGDVAAIIRDWDEAAAPVRRLAESRKLAEADLERIAIPELKAPYRPARIFCAASNFIEHANEMGTVLAAKAQSRPYMFLKLQNTVIGPGEAVRKPPETSQLDWEVELGAVIGRRARRVAVERALDYVAGYTVINDVSARDLNVRSDYPFKFDWFQGKCHDTFAPFGPCIVPAWLIADPQDVKMKLTVNGEAMQEDSTGNMIWSVREQIAYLSTIVTLEPGDVIATGTPTGVGMGRGIFLKSGDMMEASIEGIGAIRNPVEDETI